jgi:hypothetical protein
MFELHLVLGDSPDTAHSRRWRRSSLLFFWLLPLLRRRMYRHHSRRTMVHGQMPLFGFLHDFILLIATFH